MAKTEKCNENIISRDSLKQLMNVIYFHTNICYYNKFSTRMFIASVVAIVMVARENKPWLKDIMEFYFPVL